MIRTCCSVFYLFIFFFLFFIYSRFKILKASLNKLIQSHDVQRDNYCTKVFVNYYNLGKKDLQIHNSTNKTRYKLKDKIYSSFLKSFLVCLISSSFDCLLPRFKGSHRELSKYIKSFQRTFDKEKF